MSYPFDQLKKIKYKKVSNGFASNTADFFEKVIKQQFENILTINEIHRSIIDYVNSESPTYFIRLYGSFKKEKYKLQRRGFLTEYPDKTKTVFCDNTFTLLFTGMKLAGLSFTDVQLKNFLNQKQLIVGFGQVSDEKELAYYYPKGAIRFNPKGWYQAHIYPVGKGFYGKGLMKYFANPERNQYNHKIKKRSLTKNLSMHELKVLKAHFLRLIHPFNSFLIPNTKHIQYDGKNIGEEGEVIDYVKSKIHKLFPEQYQEFESYVNLEYQFPNPKKSIEKIKWFTESKNNPLKKDNNNQKQIKTNSKKRSQEGMKIGKFVQDSFRKAYEQNLITEDEIKRLQDPKYSYRIFNAGYEILRFNTISIKDSKGRTRYYAKELFCDEYCLSQQWKESQRDGFLNWLKGIGYSYK